ncbi:hypothetical protein K456DRAFT_1731795 [Colletotrichum gloeosporioides 23]|nr:hypothetical protein K456DRAFT_1731795 [Colletotrichum gloeosporioides 23]
MSTEYVVEFQSTSYVAHGKPVFIPPDLSFDRVIQLELNEEDSIILPNRFILKIEDPDNKDLFDNEVAVYDRLRSLQGDIIPEFLGVASIAGKRALLLSDIGGMAMMRAEMPRFDNAKLKELLVRPVDLVRKQGIALGDLSMCNVHWCGDAFRLVDFAHARTISPQDPANLVRDQVDDLVKCFQARKDALLQIAKLASRRTRRRSAKRSRKTARATTSATANGDDASVV